MQRLMLEIPVRVILNHHVGLIGAALFAELYLTNY